MGRRRVRCLQALGETDITGYDLRQDRCDEAFSKYGIKTVRLRSGLSLHVDAIVFICTPPKFHRHYSDFVAPRKTFIEAGIEKLRNGTPSATMMYQPQVQEIQRILPSVGKLINITYHSGQYLPDWHPYEKVSDFYAGEVGAREMVAFELTWFCKVFGDIKAHRRAERNGDEIEGLRAPDSICIVGSMESAIFSVMIDVAARKPIRQLVINGSERQLCYDLNQGISEQIYIDETKAFLDGALCNTIVENNKIIDILESV